MKSFGDWFASSHNSVTEQSIKDNNPPKVKVLTEDAQADRYNFEEYTFYSGGCSCHLNPPCSHCIHPGNPNNQEEDEECWEWV